MEAFVPGIYPRSEELVQATRDLDRGRTTQDAVDAQIERDLQQFVRPSRMPASDSLPTACCAGGHLPPAGRGGRRARARRPHALPRHEHLLPRPSCESGEPRLGVPSTSATSRRFRPSASSPCRRPSRCRSNRRDARTMAEGVLKPQIDALGADVVVLSEPFLARADVTDLDDLAGGSTSCTAGRRWRSGSRSGTRAGCSIAASRSSR